MGHDLRPAAALGWPRSPAELEREQRRLSGLSPPLWQPAAGAIVAGCFVCFPRGASGPGEPGDPAWAAAVAVAGASIVGRAVVTGRAGAEYRPGQLALREGPLLEYAVRALRVRPDVLLVDATGRDHPYRAGLALHLGAVLDLATIGVTHRPLIAAGEWPSALEAGASSPLLLDGEEVATWLRTRAGARPLVVHPAWRTAADAARRVVLASVRRARTPEPLREARRIARSSRSST